MEFRGELPIHGLAQPQQSDKLYLTQWTPEQVDQTIALANANFKEGADKVKRTVMAVYKRKMMLRLEREAKESESAHEENRKRHGIHDHFS